MKKQAITIIERHARLEKNDFNESAASLKNKSLAESTVI